MVVANQDQCRERINCRTFVLMVDINNLSQSLNSYTKQVVDDTSLLLLSQKPVATIWPLKWSYKNIVVGISIENAN